MSRKQPPGDSSSSPSKKMKTIMNQAPQQTSSSSSSPVLFPESPDESRNSLAFLGEREIKHENLQPIQSETGNLQHAFDSSGTQESYEAMMEAQRLKNEIKMIPTPIAWTIKKTLTKSDLTALCLSIKPVEEHILSRLTEIPTNRSEIVINVRDSDFDSMHKLCLGYGKNGYDHLRGFWKEDFVERKGLKEGDQIGLAWDPLASTLVFGVISGAGSSRRTVETLTLKQ